MKKLLEELCALPGISGFEYRYTQDLEEIFRRYLDEVETDCMGNVMGYSRCGVKDAPLIMLEAHFDMIGLMVNTIEEGGYCTVANIGGVDPRTLAGAEVTIHGKEELFGVVGMKPPHILTAEEMKKGVKKEDLAVDTGYSKEELEQLVQVGDPISIEGGFTCLLGDKVSSRCLDDRAGIAVLLEAVKMLENVKKNVDLCVLAAVGEEVGGWGAATGSWKIRPDAAIIVDVTHGETPDAPQERTCYVGKGPAICKGPNLHPKLTLDLENCAQKEHIPYQIEVEGGNTGTDAWVVQVVGEGIPCSLVSIPLRYMHTNIETISMEDAAQSARLIARWIGTLQKGGLEDMLCLDN